MNVFYLIIFFLNWSLSSCYIKSAPPKLSPSKAYKQKKVFPVDSIIKLQCPVNADRDHLLIQWTKNNEEIFPNERVFQTNNGLLKIETAQVEDSGLYTCKAINGFGHVYANITINVLQKIDYNSLNAADENTRYQNVPNFFDYKVLVPNARKPYFNKAPNNKPIQRDVGETLRLRCNVDGKPKPHVTWYKNGLSVDHISFPDGSQKTGPTLIIRNTRLHDSGIYKCVAMNNLGEINANFTVDIIDTTPFLPDIIKLTPVNATVLVGEKVIFECEYNSQSDSLVQWFKSYSYKGAADQENFQNRKPIEIEGAYFSSLKSLNPIESINGVYVHRLIINSTKPSDSGTYICSVINMKGFSYKMTNLQVTFYQLDESYDQMYVKASYNILCIMILLLLFISLIIFFIIMIFTV